MKQRKTRIQRLERKVKAATDLALVNSKWSAQLYQKISSLVDENVSLKQEIIKLKKISRFHEENISGHSMRLVNLEQLPNLTVLVGKLTEDIELIERVLEIMQENNGFKKDIINSHTARLDKLESAPVGFLAKLQLYLTRKKVSIDG